MIPGNRSPRKTCSIAPANQANARRHLAGLVTSGQFCPDLPPHHVAKEWADRYAGQFDDGWDAYRERTLARQKELGVMPTDAQLSRHDPDVPDWDSLSPDARRLAARMMEVFAGFLSHTDHHIGRLLDFLKEIGEFDNFLALVSKMQGWLFTDLPVGAHVIPQL
jgi:Sulfatase